MKITFDISRNLAVDAVGELLREYCFVKHGEHDFGCYSTFDLRPEFKEIEPGSDLWKRFDRIFNPEHDGWDDDIKTYAYSNGEIHVAWQWYGDGTLVFLGPDFSLWNTDCKKSYGWEYLED